MIFIIKETGEKREVTCLDGNGLDWAEDILAREGLLDIHNLVEEDDGTRAHIAPRDKVEYWAKFFASLTVCNEVLNELLDNYSSDEVYGILHAVLGTESTPPNELEATLESMRTILQKHYNTGTALLLGSYASDLPQGDFGYYEESLYRQDTGEFFLVGKGGPWTAYGRTYLDGSMEYGECTFGITLADAKEWAAKHPDNEFPAGCFEPVKA